MDPLIKITPCTQHMRRESFRSRKMHVLPTVIGIMCMSLVLLHETEGSGGMMEKLVRRGNYSMNNNETRSNSNIPAPVYVPIRTSASSTSSSSNSNSNSATPVKHSSRFLSSPKPNPNPGSTSTARTNGPSSRVTTTSSISSSVSVKSTTSPRPRSSSSFSSSSSSSSQLVSNRKPKSPTSAETTSTNEKQSQQKREILLPLEKLFPTVSSRMEMSTNSPRGFESMKVSPATPRHESPEEKLKNALLNHSLHMNDMDKELDQLVFSQLPEGSKLILKSVKIIRTDEDGNEHDEGDEATSWDIVPNNSTHDDFLNDEDINETTEFADLISAGSHPKTRSQYDTHGSNVRSKERNNKYINNRDHGKHNAQTFTDTEGGKVTNYKGNEAGLTDFEKGNGKSQANEGGRYKDSKKKNKGRKVTGFKRVYHKEEFQRTEHFYDDEEAKRIAENFGANDHKEKSAHGLKNDDRKYHGTNKEHTDGEKVKNVYGTTNSFNKGHHQTTKDAERHNQAQHHAVSHGPGHAGPPYAQPPQYHGAYSMNTNKKLITAPASPTVASPSGPDGDIEMGGGGDEYDLDEEDMPKSQEVNTRRPRTQASSRHRVPTPAPSPKYPRQKQIKAAASSYSLDAALGFPSVTMKPPPIMAKPSEMKVFFSPRERYIPYFSKDDATMAYAPNFGPNSVKSSSSSPSSSSSLPKSQPNSPSTNPMSFGYSYRTIHPNPSKQLYGSKLRNDSYGENSQNPRYAVNFPSGDSLKGNNKGRGNGDPIPPMYSTIIKTLPGQSEYGNYSTLPLGSLISIQKANGHEVSSSSISGSNSINPNSNLDSLPVPTIVTPSKGESHKNGQGSGNGGSNSNLRQQQQSKQITWIPLGQGSNSNGNSNSNNNKYPPHFSGPLPESRPNSNNKGPNKYPQGNPPLNHLRIGKTLIPTMYIRHPSTTDPVTNRRPPGPGHNPSHSHGPIVYNNPPSAPSTISYNAVRKNPQFSHFMNGLMDSVAGFFGRIG